MAAETLSELAIITGASRGIGKATAARFLGAGASVRNLSRTPCPIPGVTHYPCDLSNSAQLKTVLHGWDLSGFSRVTIVHNAALLKHDTYASLSEPEFMEVLKINVVAPQLINRQLLPQMKAGSSVIFIGSTQSESAGPDRLSYITSKHAILGLMRATANDIAEKGLHACLVAPGFTDTEMLREAIGDAAEDIARAEQATLLGRLVQPEEIAELVFFCSRNPAINGAVLHANLGQKTV